MKRGSDLQFVISLIRLEMGRNRMILATSILFEYNVTARLILYDLWTQMIENKFYGLFRNFICY